MNRADSAYSGSGEVLGFSPEAVGSFTMRDFLIVLFKHWITILISFSVVSGATIFGLANIPPTYIGEAKVLIRTEQQGSPSFLSGIAAYREPRESDPVVRKLETEMEMLTTRSLAEQVVDDLQLTWNDVYHPAYVHLLQPLANFVDWSLAKLVGIAPDPDAYGRDATVAAFMRSVSVAPTKSKSAETTSNVVSLTLKAPSARVAQVGLQRLLGAYLAHPVADADRAGREALEVIERNLLESEGDVRLAQTRIQALLGREGSALGYARAPVDMESIAGQARLPPDQNSVSLMKSRLVEMELKLVDLRQTYLESQENVVILRNSIAELRDLINRQLLSAAAAESSYSGLARDLHAAEQLYLDLRKKRDQIALFIKLNPSQIDNRSVTELPLLPRSSEWKKSVLLSVLGSFSGLILGLGLAGLREYTDQRLQHPEAVSRALGIESLGAFASLSSREVRLLTGCRGDH